MQSIELNSETDFQGWRSAARRLIAQQQNPHKVIWTVRGAGKLFAASDHAPDPVSTSSIYVPKLFVDMARRVVSHRDPERFDRLYRILWRMQASASLMSHASDPDISWLRQRNAAIRRDVHKMHAFVRFREAGRSSNGRERFAAWFEPAHRIAELAAPFFQARFASMDWLIVTPEASVWWDGESLGVGPGGTSRDAPAEDALEDGWRTYFSAIFNPARLKVKSMKGHMPQKYWRNLPEARLIPGMIQHAQARATQMVDSSITAPHKRTERVAAARQSAEDDLAMAPSTLKGLKKQASACERCPLFACASQTVFGEGPSDARLLIVGEQPGDEEDLAGRPFVGPAGRLLNECLSEAGIDRDEAYLTNAVKHFKFTPRGKRRIHEKPNAGEIDACRWWLDQERQIIRPRVVLTLGATAYRGVTGRSPKSIREVRGRRIPLDDGASLFATVHPSYLLRLPDADARRHERAAFIADVQLAAKSG